MKGIVVLLNGIESTSGYTKVYICVIIIANSLFLILLLLVIFHAEVTLYRHSFFPSDILLFPLLLVPNFGCSGTCGAIVFHPHYVKVTRIAGGAMHPCLQAQQGSQKFRASLCQGQA